MVPAEQTGTLRPGYGRDVYEDAFLRRTSKEWLEDFWANDVPVQPAVPLGEILEDEQSRATTTSSTSTIPSPGASPFPACRSRSRRPRGAERRTRARRPHRRGARRVGTATARDARRRRRRPTARSQRWPLEGVKVLDLGNFLAGPYGAMLLADLGADVIKLESSTGDQMRGVEWSFVGCQRGKRSVAIDLKSPEARPALEALIRWADVVHHNLRMPAARRLGVDYESVKAVNPEIVYCHTSSYGPRGHARRLARVRPALPVVVRMGGRRRRRGQPADVAPARVHGPPVRALVGRVHAARAVPARPHR